MVLFYNMKEMPPPITHHESGLSQEQRELFADIAVNEKIVLTLRSFLKMPFSIHIKKADNKGCIFSLGLGRQVKEKK